MLKYFFDSRSPFSDPPLGGPIPGAEGHGVTASALDRLGIAAVLVRRGQGAALAKRLREQFDIELPQGPRRNATGDIAFAGTGPQSWLATIQNGANSAVSRLKEAIGDVASISDQSDGYVVLRLTGPKVRVALRRILPVDIHSRAFKPGDVASTVAAHVGATFWRLDDAPDGSPVYDIAVFRSLTGSFCHALRQSAGHFGIVFASPK